MVRSKKRKPLLICIVLLIFLSIIWSLSPLSHHQEDLILSPPISNQHNGQNLGGVLESEPR